MNTITPYIFALWTLACICTGYFLRDYAARDVLTIEQRMPLLEDRGE